MGALNLGGIGTVAHNLSIYFSEKKFKFDIITTHHKGNDFDRALSKGWPVIDISNNEISLKKRILTTYETLIEYDVVINNHSDEVKFCLPALPVKQIKISVQHNTTVKSTKSLGFNAEYLNYWTGVSPAVTDVIKKNNPHYKRIKVLPNGVSKLNSQNHQNFKNDIIHIAYIGRLNQKQKNIFLLPEIIKQLKNRGYNIELSIAGDGEDKERLEKYFLNKKVGNEVKFLGRIGSYEIEKLFNTSDFLINPSFWEGLPMVVLEAISCGVVPILSNIEPHSYLLGEKLKKELVCDNNVESYIDKICILYDNKDHFQTISKKLVLQWKENFSINSFGKNYEHLILEAYKNKIQYEQQDIDNIKLPIKDQIKMTILYNLIQKIYRKSK